MKLEAVKKSYARWAPIYDKTFGLITQKGRERAVKRMNEASGDVLELGVGTGLALEFYAPTQRVVGIDFSEEMLAKAQIRRERGALDHVRELRQMDARVLDFPDASFDWVAAMHVLSVVPEPERVMSEISRVLRPGGRVMITNHFARERGFLAMLERITTPFADSLGWHSDFAIESVLGEDDLSIEERSTLPPFGMMTFLVLRKDTRSRSKGVSTP